MNKKKESFMLKKIMKAALAASLVFGMSSFAYAAEGKIGGSFKEYFGQANSGVSGTSGYFVNYGEANLQFKGTSGKASVFFEIQADSAVGNSSATGAKAEVSDVQRKVSYASPIGLVSIGTVVNIGAVPFNAGGGVNTSKVPWSTRRGLLMSYKEDDAIDLVIPLEGMGFVQATMYSTPGTAINGRSGQKGTATQLGANLSFSGIGVRVGYQSDKVDDPAVATDGDDTSSSTLIGVNVPIGDAMAISANIGNSTVKPADTKYSTMDLTFSMNGLGPGKLSAAYDSMDIKDVQKYAAMSVVYDVMTEKGAGFEFGYATAGTTPNGGTTTTATYILGGIYASF
jgi:hypothetical protein